MKPASWSNGRRVVTGSYLYHWASGRFWIALDKSSPKSLRKGFWVHGDSPDFGRWKLINEHSPVQGEPHDLGHCFTKHS